MKNIFVCQIYKHIINKANLLGTGYWVLGTGYWILGTGCRSEAEIPQKRDLRSMKRAKVETTNDSVGVTLLYPFYASSGRGRGGGRLQSNQLSDFRNIIFPFLSEPC